MYVPDRACPKCGASHATSQYVGRAGYDAIKRKCQRCGYGWLEEPLDAPHDTEGRENGSRRTVTAEASHTHDGGKSESRAALQPEPK